AAGKAPGNPRSSGGRRRGLRPGRNWSLYGRLALIRLPREATRSIPGPTDRGAPTMTDLSHNHDVITIGTSSGGVDALRRLVRDLPADLLAAAFVVLHIGSRSHLVPILNQDSR